MLIDVPAIRRSPGAPDITRVCYIISGSGKALIDHLAKIPLGSPAGSQKVDLVRFDIANRLFLRLYQASNLMHKTGTKAVSDFGATTQQWAVLGALSRPGVRDHGMTVKELIAFLMVSRQNLTAVLDRLEGAGLVERIRVAGDGRLRHVRLTAQGESVWSEMLVSIRRYYNDALAGFSTEECLLLFRLLDRLRDGLGRIVVPEGE
ncbi:MarR family winged helix-turn-helix transcriptional regulator [Dankookia rubra]|uniref:MarR family winged helix-turn-helix transcriptional regulator n=1 Tax=Dankookia rubra TaxID=1442381 RepID=UPI0019D562FC|nr:MarR family transcriptional regulator [Dankookia rubra]